MKVKLKNEIVCVDWVDSSRFDGWHKHQAGQVDASSLHCTSVGIIIEDAPDYVTMSSHVAWPSMDVCGSMMIPRCAITKIRKLGVELEYKGRQR